jgi:cytochrome c oxidase subunit 2
MQPLMDGSSIRADEAYVTESMMDPAAKIVRGFAPVMPSYQGLLQPADTAAIVEFIKSLRNPNTPHVTTPPPAGPIPGVTAAPAPGDHR